MSSNTLAWRSHSIAIGGVSLDLVDGQPILEGDAAGFHYVSQAHPPVQLDVARVLAISLPPFAEPAAFAVHAAKDPRGR